MRHLKKTFRPIEVMRQQYVTRLWIDWNAFEVSHSLNVIWSQPKAAEKHRNLASHQCSKIITIIMINILNMALFWGSPWTGILFFTSVAGPVTMNKSAMSISNLRLTIACVKGVKFTKISHTVSLYSWKRKHFQTNKQDRCIQTRSRSANYKRSTKRA